MTGRAEPVTDWWGYAQRLRTRRRLAVLACDAADVAACAGGWLFDRAQAGWETVVVLADVTGSAPLRILGATVLELEGPLSVPVHHTWPDLLVVAPGLYTSDPRVRQGVQDCVHGDRLTVITWDQPLPAELEDRFTHVGYPLSDAARAFKARAVAAAGTLPAAIESLERFRVSTRRDPFSPHEHTGLRGKS